MLRFTDFAHLPEIDGLVQELIGESAGLIVVAGLDSRPALEATTGPMATFLPSGRATIFRVLVSDLFKGKFPFKEFIRQCGFMASTSVFPTLLVAIPIGVDS